MAEEKLNQVLQKLNQAGIQAGRGFPAEKLPLLTAPAAAVGIEQLDPKNGTVTISVTVCGPGRLGGAACEETAMAVVNALSGQGGISIRKGCRYDGKADLFTMSVYCTCPLILKKKFEVKIGPGSPKWLRRFRTGQQLPPPGTQAPENPPWEFYFEEYVPAGEQEFVMPNEPFEIIVKRSGIQERYRQCRLTEAILEDREDGLHIRRSGIAADRVYVEFS